MNQFDSPPENQPGEKTEEAEALATGKQPFVATLVDEQTQREGGQPVREGSPFRPGTETQAATRPDFQTAQASDQPAGPSYADLGPMRYTAMGAASAAVVVLLFAGLGAWWFPAGGALVAVLGAVLSIIGLFARQKFRYTALGTLTLHIGLFMVSYVRSFS